MPTETQNFQSQTLAHIFYQALRAHIPNLRQEDVSARGYTRNGDEISSHEIAGAMLNMHVAGIRDRVNHYAETDIKFPEIQDQRLLSALQKTARALTGHWVTYCTDGIQIKADLNTTAAIITDPDIFKRKLDAFLTAEGPN